MTFTVLDETRAVAVDATVAPDGVRLAPSAVRDALGWELKPQGLCKDERCILVAPAAPLVRDGAIDLATLADLLDRPLALDPAEGAACLGVAADDAGTRSPVARTRPTSRCPTSTASRTPSRRFRGKKVLLVAFASW